MSCSLASGIFRCRADFKDNVNWEKQTNNPPAQPLQKALILSMVDTDIIGFSVLVMFYYFSLIIIFSLAIPSE